MSYRVARTTDFETCQLLHRDLLAGDVMPAKDCVWWLIKTPDGTPAGFAAAQYLPDEKSVFMARAGVYPAHRGHRLQLRLLKARERWGREQGADTALTYTHRLYARSMRSLIRAGYRPYYPDWKWAGPDMVYWIKKL